MELTGSRDITVVGKGWVDQVNSAARAFHASASARAGVYYRETNGVEMTPQAAWNE
jgi:hypothetical protein